MAARKQAAKSKANAAGPLEDEWTWYRELNQLSRLIIKYRGRFEASLGKQRPFDMWLSQAIGWCEVSEVQRFRSVTPAAIVNAFNAAAIMGLLINGEECMVMVRGQKTPKVKCEVGRDGVIRRLGIAGIKVQSRTIKEGDEIEIDEAQGIVKHQPAWVQGKESGETLGFYATARYPDGYVVVRTLSIEEALKRSTGTGAWNNWEDQMGEKSAVLALRKVIATNDDLMDAMAESGAVYGDDWALREAEKDAAEAPTYPPQTTQDRLHAQLARDQQDRDTEGPAEPDEVPDEEDDEDVYDEEPPPSTEDENNWPDEDMI